MMATNNDELLLLTGWKFYGSELQMSFHGMWKDIRVRNNCCFLCLTSSFNTVMMLLVFNDDRFFTYITYENVWKRLYKYFNSRLLFGIHFVIYFYLLLTRVPPYLYVFVEIYIRTLLE